MAKYVQKHRNTGYECNGSELAEQDAVAQEEDRRFKEDVEYSDELLSDIDEVLADVLGDHSAQKFVAQYRQQGGE